MSYFYSGAALPPLRIGISPPIRFDELLFLLEMNGRKRDRENIRAVRRFIDMKNAKALLMGRTIDGRGNMTERDLANALENRFSPSPDFPDYLIAHLKRYDTTADRVARFGAVFVAFFDEMARKSTSSGGFLRFYFTFEREFGLLMAGFRARRLHLDPTKELLDEDPKDPLVAMIIGQKEQSQYVFPPEYEELSELLNEVGNDPMKQHRAMIRYRFDTIFREVRDRPFSSDFLSVYFVGHLLVQDSVVSNPEEGQRKLEEIASG
ncbi:MAG: DUF2764 family protein [Simkaniaceae bacterium]|nr:DUF2764 family protein [Simkaniaceae bacterium]